ncbi:lipase 1-like [Aphomia sociella]
MTCVPMVSLLGMPRTVRCRGKKAGKGSIGCNRDQRSEDDDDGSRHLEYQSELLDIGTELFKFLLNGELYVKELVSKYSPLQSHISEDGKLNFKELAVKYGFDCEEHKITTNDGYILTMFHIPGKGRPLLLMHGILDYSDTFIIRGNISLALTLAKAGYDVWTGNFRGTKYSLGHIKLDANVDKDFWNFTLHELGYYDYPAFIDYVLNKTNEQNLTVIGHSQGTSTFFVMCSLRPDYNDKVNIIIALAPIAFLNNMRGPVNLFVEAAPALKAVADLKGTVSILEYNSPLRNISRIACTQEVGSYELCVKGQLFAILGSDPKQLEREFIHVIFGHYPGTTSLKNLYQYAQIAKRKKFAEYDYGEEQNMALYGSASPPEYNLKKVTSKIALFVAPNDYISTIEDTALLRKQLPNVVEYREMPKNMNHIDFVWGNRMPVTLYPYIFDLLEKYP